MYETRSVPGSRLRNYSSASGEFTARVLSYGKADHHQSVWRRGVFAKSLARSMPTSCWSHDLSRPIGKAVDANDTAQGLDVRVKLADPEAVPDAKMARSLLADGIISQFSFTFDRHPGATLAIPREQRNNYGPLPAREFIVGADLVEISPVVAASGVDTKLLSVRAKSRGAMIDRNLDGELERMFSDIELRVAIHRAGEHVEVERRSRVLAQAIEAERDAPDAGTVAQAKRMERRLRAGSVI
jgi:HK97 family phage prohead protease